MNARNFKTLAAPLLIACLLFTGGCSKVSGMFGGDDSPALKGERISVLELQKSLEPDDPNLEAHGLITPDPWKNEFWPQAGGYPNHSMQNLHLGQGSVKRLWKADIGQGMTDELPLVAQPILVDGRIFTLDTDSALSAFDAGTGKQLWRANVRDLKEDDPVISGGLAFSGGSLYVTNGYDEILAVNPASGKIVWRKKIAAPSRAAPTILDGRIFVTTLDNRLLALSARDGTQLWEYSGLSETAALVGAASPAAGPEIVIPAFSSGEITALRVENGAVAWTDNLSSVRAIGGLESLSHIKALPVMDKGLVLAISFSGRIVAINQSSGERVWERELGGSNTPWVAGNHVFVLTSDQQVVALGRDTGVIRWITKLRRFKNPDSKSGPVNWTGPILAGGRLLVFSDTGQAAELDPQTGKIASSWETGQRVTISPIVTGGVLYVLGNDGTLAAYK